MHHTLPTMHFQFLLFHKGQKIDGLQWLPELGQYRIKGKRERIGKDVLFDAQDQASAQCWATCEKATTDLKSGKINLPAWRKILSNFRAEVHLIHDFIMNGGLDPDAREEAWKDVLDPALSIKRMTYRHVDDMYISHLCGALLAGEHGPNFQQGDIEIRAKVLFLECIHVYSPWHEDDFIETIMAEAYAAYEQGVLDFYNEKNRLEINAAIS